MFNHAQDSPSQRLRRCSKEFSGETLSEEVLAIKGMEDAASLIGTWKETHLSFPAQTLSLPEEWHLCYTEQTGLGQGLGCINLPAAINAYMEVS